MNDETEDTQLTRACFAVLVFHQVYNEIKVQSMKQKVNYNPVCPENKI